MVKPQYKGVDHWATCPTQILQPKDTHFSFIMITFQNTLNFHKYFKVKLTSHQRSQLHDTRHRINNNFNTPIFNHSKMFLASSNSHVEQPSSLFKNCIQSLH